MVEPAPCANRPVQITHWTGRAIAKAIGLSLRTIQRIWVPAHKLPAAPDQDTSSRSNDPDFAAKKLDDVVGLYMNPLRHAAVVSIDEKSQIQALNRTQPGLPLKRGKCATLTHLDYKRHGTTTLFAALSVLEGKVIGRCVPPPSASGVHPLHRNPIERSVPAGKVIHATSSTTMPPINILGCWPGSPNIRDGRSTCTPTSCSWLNAVEGFFKLTRQRPQTRRLSLLVDDLENAITRYIAATNRHPKPFVCTATAKTIQAKLKLNHPSESVH